MVNNRQIYTGNLLRGFIMVFMIFYPCKGEAHEVRAATTSLHLLQTSCRWMVCKDVNHLRSSGLMVLVFSVVSLYQFSCLELAVVFKVYTTYFITQGKSFFFFFWRHSYLFFIYFSIIITLLNLLLDLVSQVGLPDILHRSLIFFFRYHYLHIHLHSLF